MAIVTASALINITSSIILVGPTKFSSTGIDDSYYKTLYVLDNKPLTNHGRSVSSDYSQVMIENKNWNNSKNRYYKISTEAGKVTFNLSWSFLPNSRYQTADQRYGRDFLSQIATNPDVHILKVYNNDESGTTAYTQTQYNVFIKDYNENLIRRDLNNNVYYWNCNMVLEEV